jgi:hypothetical protein
MALHLFIIRTMGTGVRDGQISNAEDGKITAWGAGQVAIRQDRR